MKPLVLSRLLLPALLLTSLPLHAEVKLSKVFTPHMVLQREMPVPIWGTATAGEKVEVKFRDQAKTATAGADGKWSVKLDALKVGGGPEVLTIGDKKIEDVLVGDVWVGSGQSNMDMATKSYTAGDPGLATIVAESYPQIHLLRKEANAVWEEASPATIKDFSAMLFSFGVPLQKELKIPVGLMVGAVGGTPSGHWLSEEMYNADPACKAAVEKFAKTYDFDAEMAKYKPLKEKFDQDFAAWKVVADDAKKEGKTPPRAPGAPPVPLHAGEPRGKIGNLFESFVRPYVGYAIKGVLWDQGESGTAITGCDQYSLMGALIKGWRKDWGQGDFPFLYVQKPSGGGCAWDYSDPVTAKGNPFSPLPPNVPPAPGGDYTHPVYLRLMNYPNTIMVTSTDLGPGTHPTNKSGYGIRGARTALAAVYGQKHEYYGPLYASHQIAGDKVTIKFTHTGKGLAFKNGDKLQGFAIAGEDGKFVWGDAAIQGDTVIVSSATVPKPAIVSYAWSGNFPWANLFNQEGLPAQPFRTDVTGK